MDDSKPCAGFEDQSQCDQETPVNFANYVDHILDQTAKAGPQGAAGVDAAAQAERSDQQIVRQEYQNNAGSESSNTDPLNLQRHPLSSIDTLTTGGLDHLSLSYYGNFNEELWDQLIKNLSECQKSAQEDDKLNALLKITPDLMVLVAPNGKGRGMSYSKWLFSYKGVFFAIRDQTGKSKSDQKIPAVFVDASSSPLMTLGETRVFELIHSVLKAIGFSFFKVCPSRIDMCVDLIEVPTSRFYDSIKKWCYVSRASHSDFIFQTRNIQTIYIGKGGSKTLLRIYDKYQECKDKSQKYDLLKTLRWGKDPDPSIGATRVEYQIRRQHLKKQHSIDSYEDFVKKKADLCKYLTHDWFRITDKEPDPRHTERFGPSALWQQVINAFEGWTGKEVERRAVDRTTNRDPIQLEKQAMGCIERALAIRGLIPNSRQELNQMVLSMVQSNGNQMESNIYIKRKELESYHPIRVVD